MCRREIVYGYYNWDMTTVMDVVDIIGSQLKIKKTTKVAHPFTKVYMHFKQTHNQTKL